MPATPGTARLVLTNASVYSPGIPFATSLIVDAGVIAWVGDMAALPGQQTDADVVVDCGGALLAPAFFDVAYVPDQGADGLGAGLSDNTLWQRRTPLHFDPVDTVELSAGSGIVTLGPDADPRYASELAAGGTPFAFGSSGNPVDYWAWIRRISHSEDSSLSTRAAFNAATRAGWRLVGDPESGAIRPGAPADVNLWACEALIVHTPDNRVAAWSTDVRSGTPPLPDLSPDLPLPQLVGCVIGNDYYDWTGLGRADEGSGSS